MCTKKRSAAGLRNMSVLLLAVIILTANVNIVQALDVNSFVNGFNSRRAAAIDDFLTWGGTRTGISGWPSGILLHDMIWSVIGGAIMGIMTYFLHRKIMTKPA